MASTAKNQYRKSHLCRPFLGIARPQLELYSCIVWESIRNCLSKLKVPFAVLFFVHCLLQLHVLRDSLETEKDVKFEYLYLSIQNVINTPHIQIKSLFLYLFRCGRSERHREQRPAV
jgi:hypothetical protein